MSEISVFKTESVNNDHLRAEYLTQGTPRMIGLYMSGEKKNLLAETPDIKINTHFGEYALLGGHRLWTAPENPEFSRVPYSGNLKIESGKDWVKLTAEKPNAVGIRKEIDIVLHSDRPAVTIDHYLTYEGDDLLRVAPCAITQFPLEGIVIMPQNLKLGGEIGLQPNRNIVLWPFAKWGDPRLEIEDDLIFFQATNDESPFKFGHYSGTGWAAYLGDHGLVVKRIVPQNSYFYTDLNSNVESFVDNRHIELATLGILMPMAYGDHASHREVWEIYSEVKFTRNKEAIREALKKLNLI